MFFYTTVHTLLELAQHKRFIPKPNIGFQRHKWPPAVTCLYVVSNYLLLTSLSTSSAPPACRHSPSHLTKILPGFTQGIVYVFCVESRQCILIHAKQYECVDEINCIKMEELLKNKTFQAHAVATAVSATLGTALTYPLDTLKVLIQVGSISGQPLTTTFVLNRVQAISGYSGLYNGVGWLTIGRTLGLGVRFGTYEILTAWCKDGREDNHVYVSEALMSGFAAGTIESIISSPFEMLKLRAQVASASRVQHSSRKSVIPNLTSRLLSRYSLDMTAMNNTIGLLSTLPSKHANLSGALKEYPWMMTGSGRPPPVTNVRRPLDIVSLEGWGALWRGTRSGLVRDSIFGGVFFSTWQILHQAMLNWKAVGMDPVPRYDEEAGPLSPLAVSLAAGVSGSFAAAVSHGFDTARSRSQCTVLPEYVSMERKFLKWNRPGKRFERLTGIHPSDRNLLLNGIWLRMARSGIGSFLIVGSYFLAVDRLVSN